uniref:Uncharacterized protein n=1 Tax=Ficus carica TaxID=3494 RepID=A0AA88CIE1_FICCA|nr:hypothetical protein TIFTF001_040119 [Ficus carica]GMN21863.1 hypothetical protein TIFTF001_040127 [Ficus carica]
MPRPLTYFFLVSGKLLHHCHRSPHGSTQNFHSKFSTQTRTQGCLQNPDGPPVMIRQLETLLFIKNHIIPDEVWPKPEEDAPWEKFPANYTKQIKEVLDKANAGPSSTPKIDEPKEDQTISFQSEGLSLEEEFQFIQWAQNPYSPEPFNPEDFIKLGISPPPNFSQGQPQSTQSCLFKYQIA